MPPIRVPAVALARACHPLPTLAVTTFAAAYAVASGATAGRTVLLALAVLPGQLAVGWTNDAVDEPLDAAAGRADKPLVGTRLRRRTVAWAAVLAGATTVPLSLGLGLLPGSLHLVAVVAALSYDLRLKGTVASPVPYLVAFGLLPPVAALTGAGTWPPVSHVAAASLLGLAAHLSNTVADAEADARTGVRGLPQRLGPATSARAAAVTVTVAAVVLLAGLAAGRSHGEGVLAAAGCLGAAVVVSALGAVLGGRAADGADPAGSGFLAARTGRAAFRSTLASVALVLTALLLTGAA